MPPVVKRMTNNALFGNKENALMQIRKEPDPMKKKPNTHRR